MISGFPIIGKATVTIHIKALCDTYLPAPPPLGEYSGKEGLGYVACYAFNV